MPLKFGTNNISLIKKSGSNIMRMMLNTVSYVIGNTNTFTTLPTIVNLTTQNGSLVAEIGTTLTYTAGQINGIPVTGETANWRANGSTVSTNSTFLVPSTLDNQNILIEVIKNSITGSSTSYPIKYAIPIINGTPSNVNITIGNGIYTGSLRPNIIIPGDLLLQSATFNKISGLAQFSILNNGDWTFDSNNISLIAGSYTIIAQVLNSSNVPVQLSFNFIVSTSTNTADINFGELTRVGAGGVATSEANGVYGQFTVAGGIITPNTTPLTVGNTTVGNTTVGVVLNEYSVASIAEYEVVKGLLTTTGNKIIRFRGNTYNIGNNYSIINTAFTNRVIITAEPGNLFTGSIKVGINSTNITISNLQIHCTDPSVNGVIDLQGSCTAVEITQNDIHGVYHDPNGDYSLGGVATMNGIMNSSSGGSPYLNGANITRNKIYDIDEGIVLILAGAGNVEVSDNEIYHNYSDYMKWSFSTAGSAAINCVKSYQRNYCHRPFGDPSDQPNPHIDCIQMISTAIINGIEIPNVIYRQNIFINTSSTRGKDVQGFFCGTDGQSIGGVWLNPVICGNILIIDGNHHMTFRANGGIIAHNLILNSISLTKSSGQPRINIPIFTNPCNIFRNIWEIPPAQAGHTFNDNLLLGRRGTTIPYSTVFDGPTWEPSSISELSSFFNRKAGGPADAGFGIGPFGTNYGVYGLPRTPSSWSFNPDRELLNPGVIQVFTLTPMPFDGYVFGSVDNANSTAYVRGTATSGLTIQARGVSVNGNTAWGSAVVDIQGNYAVPIPIPSSQWGNWYTVEARIGTDDTSKLTNSVTFGCGKVIAIQGQSELEHFILPSSYYSNVPYPLLSAQNMTLVYQDLTGTNPGPINSRKMVGQGFNQINVGLFAIANAFNRALPNRKLMVVDLAESGTNRGSLMNDGDDASGGRKWSDYLALVNFVRAGLSDIDDVIECWYNSDAATIKTFMLEWAPFYFGERSGGGAFTLGTVNPDSTRNPSKTVDHCLWDITANADTRGRGLYARNRTKYTLLGPMVFTDTSNTTEQTNFSQVPPGNARITQLDRPARDSMITFFTDGRTQTFAKAFGPSAHVVDFGSGIHPLVDSKWGVAQFAMNIFPAIANAAGYTIKEPTIVSSEVPSDGSYADIVVDLPNNGLLTTIRSFANLPAANPKSPHQQNVTGFEIRRATDSDNQRRPVFNLSETTYPQNYRGTVTIFDAGSGVAPNRRAKVRITPEIPFITNDKIEYLRGQASAHILKPRDAIAQLFLDMMIEHIPALYDSNQLYPLYGIPIRPQPPLITLIQGTSGGGGVDTTAPILTSPTGSSTGQTTAIGSVTTDEVNGNLYWVCILASETIPSEAQIKAGQTSSNLVAPGSGSSPVSTIVSNVSTSSLTASTNYKFAYVQVDAAVPGNTSNIVVSSTFTTQSIVSPTNTFNTAVAGPYFKSLSNVPAGTTGITFQTKFKLSSLPAAGTTKAIFAQMNVGFDAEILPAGTLRINVKDSANVRVINNSGVSGFSGFVINTWYDVIISADHIAQKCYVTINGTNYGPVGGIPFASAGTGIFQSNYPVIMLSRNSGSLQLVAEVEFCKVWYESTNTGLPPVNPPFKTVAGNAATVNVDSWKLGANAT